MSSYILLFKNIYTIILNIGLLQTLQWMSRDENVPHLFLSTTMGGSSTCSAIQGAGSDLAVHVSMCLTPNGCLILLASGSMHQNWRTACASTRKDCCHPHALMFLLCQTRPTDPWVPATHPQHASSPQGTGLLSAFSFFNGPMSVFLQWELMHQANIHPCFPGWR